MCDVVIFVIIEFTGMIIFWHIIMNLIIVSSYMIDLNLIIIRTLMISLLIV